jgi:hypothetical protein
MKPAFEDIVCLDFETFFSKDYTLSSLSTSEYIRDPRFRAHMIGIRRGLEPARWYPHDEIPRVLAEYDVTNSYVLAQNTAFDGFILSHHYGVIPKGYLDTRSMSAALWGAHVSSGLKAICERLGLPGKMEGVLEKSKGLEILPPDIEDETGEYCCVDVDQCFEAYRLMVDHMPDDEMEVINITLRMFCDPVLELDEELARYAQSIPIARKTAALMTTGVDKKNLTSNAKFAALLKLHKVICPLKVSKTTGKLIPALAKTDAGFKELLRHPDPDVRDLAEARLAFRSTIEQTRAERLIEAGKNGLKVPVYLNYCGAHTTRWSGGNKMNMQNLPRPRYDENKNLIEDTGLLRRSLLAPAGHQLVVCDASQIEARVTAWLAGQDDMINDFRQGRDVYRIFGSGLYGKPPELITKDERFLSKTCVLGLGFGMSAAKLQITLAMGTGGPEVDLPYEECYAAVQYYRRRNHRIKALWQQLDAVLGFMATPPKPGKPHKELELGPLAFGYGYVRLPNGLFLHYPDLQYEPGEGRYHYRGRGGSRTYIYGAMLLENLVQALSRTMIAENMVALHRAGIRIVTMTHDEIVALARDDDAERVFQLMLRIMVTPPSWGRDLPLAAEGGYDRRYSK